uniref:Putative secreted protein n=1 Tax=Ixodes scapularis TaxID=6945 RepID=A0A4D5RAW2_IXOSC
MSKEKLVLLKPFKVFFFFFLCMYFIQRRHSLVGQSDGNLFGVCCCEGCCTMTLFAVECEMFLVLTSGESGVLRCVFGKESTHFS